MWKWVGGSGGKTPGSEEKPKRPSMRGTQNQGPKSQPELPETLRSKLVTQGAEVCGGGMLKRSATDDLERPGTVLGRGTFGTVKLRHDKNTGEPRAVKNVNKPDHWDRARLVHEAIIMQNLDHPHIVRIFGWQEAGDSITMVMEYCAGGEFLDAVKNADKIGDRFHEGWGAMAFSQLFEAFSYCHDRGLVHMDVKSGNILLMSGPGPEGGLYKVSPHTVVADLGLAQILDPNPASWFRKKIPLDARGTAATMAPEVWRGDAGPKSDMWGLGCVLYEVLTQKLPYMPDDHRDTRKTTWEKLHKEGQELARGRIQTQDCSEEVKTLCWTLLAIDEKDRPMAKDCLTNPWFQRFLKSCPRAEEGTNLSAICEACCHWPRLRPMQRALCLKLAADSKGTSKFARIFAGWDTDNSGTLSQTELVAALKTCGVDDTKARSVAQALDYNRDGTCEYLEFAAACLSSLGEEYDDMLRREFGMLDSMATGYLDKAGFRRLLNMLKPLSTSRNLGLVDFDTDGDGQVSFLEFAAIFGRPGTQYEDNPRANASNNVTMGFRGTKSAPITRPSAKSVGSIPAARSETSSPIGDVNASPKKAMRRSSSSKGKVSDAVAADLASTAKSRSLAKVPSIAVSAGTTSATSTATAATTPAVAKAAKAKGSVAVSNSAATPRKTAPARPPSRGASKSNITAKVPSEKVMAVSEKASLSKAGNRM
eukprot:TRINITY_DN40915_c0_g1_i1.p1 TRINITY_DN40915_c0_g1~~TRINITY_DN40915_c0_g1_i1.p1  ORF type:complete len:706 (-),score=91.97 TRINITY_DN40915_c0_g1_i1:39-2156(-)